MQHKLEKQNIILNSENILDHAFSLELQNTKVFYDQLESANIKQIELNTFYIYNSLQIQDVKLSGMASSFVPINIKNIVFTYSILNPLQIKLHSHGEFGDLDGSFDILDNHIYITLKPSKKMLQNYKKTLRYLTKNKNGEYIYDAVLY
jgi:hypothetical protein